MIGLRSVQLRAYLWLLVWGIAMCLTPFGITDVSASRNGHLVNCRDPNISQSGRLCLYRAYRTVRHSPTLLFSAFTVIDVVG